MNKSIINQSWYYVDWYAYFELLRKMWEFGEVIFKELFQSFDLMIYFLSLKEEQLQRPIFLSREGLNNLKVVWCAVYVCIFYLISQTNIINSDSCLYGSGAWQEQYHYKCKYVPKIMRMSLSPLTHLRGQRENWNTIYYGSDFCMLWREH